MEQLNVRNITRFFSCKKHWCFEELASNKPLKPIIPRFDLLPSFSVGHSLSRAVLSIRNNKLNNDYNNYFRESRESNLGPLGEKREHYSQFYAATETLLFILKRNFTLWFENFLWKNNNKCVIQSTNNSPSQHQKQQQCCCWAERKFQWTEKTQIELNLLVWGLYR